MVHSLARTGQISHFLPEGGHENSPGWSVAQSGEGAPTKSARPIGAERATFMPSSDVHAIALWFRSKPQAIYDRLTYNVQIK